MSQYKLPISQVPGFKNAFEKLENICLKLSLPLPTCKFVQDVQEEGWIEDPIFGKTKVIREYQIWFVEGDEPKLNGWRFLSKLEKMGDGDEIRSVPGFNLPEEFKTRETCDHCKQNRKRNRYFFVENDDQTELKQVGSSCVKDFLGHASPDLVASWFETIQSFVSFEEDEEYNGARPAFLFFRQETLAVAINQIKKYGFLSRKMAEERGIDLYQTTGCIIQDVLYHNHSQAGKHYQVKEEDAANIAAFEKFFAAKNSTDNDFITNIKNTLEAGLGIRPQKMGVLAAGVNMWIKETSEKKEFVASVYWPGQAKDKVSAKVKFLRSVAFEGDYGTTHLYTFSDGVHEFVWSTGKEIEFSEAEEVTIQGSVKGFKLWIDRNNREHKQTLLTRCKIIEE